MKGIVSFATITHAGLGRSEEEEEEEEKEEEAGS